MQLTCPHFLNFLVNGFVGTQYATLVKFLDQALVASLLAEFDHIIDVGPLFKGLVLGTFQTHTAQAHTHTHVYLYEFFHIKRVESITV